MGKRAEKGSGQPYAVRVSVFTDVLLITELVGHTDADGGERLKLLLDAGISKILDLDSKEQPGMSGQLVKLALLMICPVDTRAVSPHLTAHDLHLPSFPDQNMFCTSVFRSLKVSAARLGSLPPIKIRTIGVALAGTLLSN